jgi:prepilin-type N-terminal cleavage/methylation domain-containing protein
MNLARNKRSSARGFTLIEVVIALGLMAALIISCAFLATANIQLANGINRQQSENTLRESFFDMMKMQLTSLPGKYPHGADVYQGHAAL